MSDNYDKKQFLMQYGFATRRMLAAEYEYMEFSYSLIGKGVTYDGMPHGGPSGDSMAAIIAKKLELEKTMLAEITMLGDVRMRIREKIEALPTEAEKLVLTLRYMNLVPVHGDDGTRVVGYDWKPWHKVAEGACFTTRHTLRLHGIALSHLSITPEEFAAVGMRAANARCH